VHSTQLPAEEEEKILSGWRDRLLSLEKEGKLEGSYAGILHTKNDSLADAVINDGTETLFGKDYFYEELLGLNFKITPFSFFQTNTLGAEKLYAKVQKYSSFSENAEEKPVIYDLYSGTGTITQLMSKVAKQAIGVEIVEEAVEAAKENAKENKVENCIFYAGDVLKVLEAGQGATELPYPDFIIVDPPRDGMHKKALEKIISYGVKRLVYVACKPKSLARDLEALQNAGYKVQKLCAVDMFPRTNNCEVVALLEKEES
jgi:trmA family RNA methyltransferase